MKTYAEHWDLSPDIVHLNHGSFGACPRIVREYQRTVQDQVERDPDLFFITEAEDRLMLAKAELARFLKVDPAALVWVRNATTGVNAVLRSIPFGKGEEIVVTDHIYNACQNVIDYVQREKQVIITKVIVPAQPEAASQIADMVLDRVSSRTRLVMLDHIASASALIFPIEEILRELQKRGIESLIDGAHVPGQIDLNLSALGATYYTGNCHKWLFAPRGTAFLYAQRDRQPHVQPAVISHGSNAISDHHSDYQLRFKWGGTDELSAYLTVPYALQFPQSLGFSDWSEVARRNHELVINARAILCGALEMTPAGRDSVLGAMAIVPIPETLTNRIDSLPLKMKVPENWHFREQLLKEQRWRLWQYLYEVHRIDVLFTTIPGDARLFLRISAQLYNCIDHYQQLAQALETLVD